MKLIDKAIHQNSTLRLLLGTLLLVAGTVLLLVTSHLDDLIGVGFLIVGSQFLLCHHLIGVIWRSNGPALEQYKQGFEFGRTTGRREGRREGRPVVVPIVRNTDGAAQQDIFSS